MRNLAQLETSPLLAMWNVITQTEIYARTYCKQRTYVIPHPYSVEEVIDVATTKNQGNATLLAEQYTLQTHNLQ